jgi:hypothetical protein
MPSVHRAPAAALRVVLVLLSALAVCLVAVVLFTAAYRWLVRDEQERQQQEMALTTLRQQAQARFDAGDCIGAKEAFGNLLATVPADPTAQAAIQVCEARDELDRLYAEAVDAELQGNGDRALGLYRQITERDAEFRDVPDRIEDLEEEAAKEALWRQAQDSIQAGDWAAAVDALAQLRARDLEYRRREVEEQLYQAYASRGQQLLSEARGSSDVVREAIGYMSKALAMQPRQDALMEELWLATGFVSGAEAAARGDWETAVVRWEPVYEARPDYQAGILEERLYEAYPKAADQLIDRAQGVGSLLDRAAHYLDRALARVPDNEVWREERRLASEYLIGAEAFAEENWETAVARWGEIYVKRPGYQDGVLEEKLRDACNKSPEPDSERCPPIGP